MERTAGELGCRVTQKKDRIAVWNIGASKASVGPGRGNGCGKDAAIN